MGLIRTLSIVLLLAIALSSLGLVGYSNYRLDRDCERLFVEILTDSQLRVGELEARVASLQQQEVVSSNRQEQSTVAALPVRFVALESDNIIDLRPEPQEFANLPDDKSPDDYWDELQRYAERNDYLRLNPQKQRKFLEEGADLIQKLEEVETHFRIDSESIQFIEARLGEEGIEAIESLYRVKKQLAGYISEGKQYRRELESMLRETPAPRLPKVIHQLPRIEGRDSEYYHPALADSWVICDSKGNFLLTIRFVYRSEVGGFPRIANVQDTINLRTMQSINGSYHYPEYFIEEIYSLVRKNFRNGFLRFHGMERKDEQLQEFLSLIS